MKKKSLWYYIIFGAAFYLVTRLLLNHFGTFDKILELAKESYASYGPAILFLAGFFEAIVIVGLYFPGSTIILVGATLASTGVISVPAVIGWTTAGVVGGYIVSYGLGRLGGESFINKCNLKRQIDEIKVKTEKSKLIYLWSTFHPNVAAVVSVAAGFIGTDFYQFLFGITVGQLIWSTIWALVFYYFGLVLLNKISLVLGIILVGLICAEVVNIFRHKNHTPKL